MEKKERRRQKGECRTHNIAVSGRFTVNNKRAEWVLFLTNASPSSVFGDLTLVPPDYSRGAFLRKQLKDQVGRHLSSHNTFLPARLSVSTQVFLSQ
jgi:hypothetical protein